MTGVPAPLVSVLIPAFNHERYLKAALNSVWDSSHRPIELVLLDDGSQDSSLSIAHDWASQRDKQRDFQVRIFSQSNAGIVVTLNRLIEMAFGDYVCLLASDDELLPDGISTRLSYLLSNPQYAAVFGDAQLIDDEGALIDESALRGLHKANTTALSNSGARATELILRWSVPGPVLMARRDVFDPRTGVGRYDERLRIEDRDFYLRLLASKQLGFVAQPVARYRLHGHNISRAHKASWVAPDMWRAESANIKNFRKHQRLLLRLVAWRNYLVATETSSSHPQRALYSVPRRLLSLWLRIAYTIHVRTVNRCEL